MASALTRSVRRKELAARRRGQRIECAVSLVPDVEDSAF